MGLNESFYRFLDVQTLYLITTVAVGLECFTVEIHELEDVNVTGRNARAVTLQPSRGKCQLRN